MDQDEQQVPPPPPGDSAMPDAPDEETMEMIRRRRLAKLGSSNPPPEPTVAAPPAPIPKPADPPPRAPTPKDPTPAQPEPKSPVPARKTNTIKIEGFEMFADRVLCDILRATVDPGRPTDSRGNTLAFLPNLSQELVDAGEQPRLTANVLDSAILEAAMALPQDVPLLSYLLPCWVRAQTQRRNPPKNAGQEKLALLDEAKRLCISNCLFALTMPSLFGREAGTEPGLIPHLLQPPGHPESIDDEFLREAVLRFSENEDLGAVFVDAMVNISSTLAKLSMEVDFKVYIDAMLLYCRVPALLDLLAEHEAFVNAPSAPTIETNTILGPFFKLSPLKSETVSVLFGNPRGMDKGSIARSQDSMRHQLGVHQNDLFTITNAFVRASLPTRGRVLDWFANIMNLNHKRRALQVVAKEVASDAFMLNVTRVLDRLCEPFMDTSFSKMDRINVDYFRQSPRLDIKEETKLNADQAASDAFYESPVPGTPHFISEIFFLTLASHHYGLEGVVSRLKTLEREIKFYEKNIAILEDERRKFLNSPAHMRQFEQTLNKHIKVLETAIGTKHAIEGLLEDAKMQEVSLRFMRYVTVWLLRVASKTDYTPDKRLHLPLPEDEPHSFACLPEYALQTVLDNFKFAYRYLPQILPFSTGDELIALCISFLECSEYIKNPYLKASLVTLLFSGTWPLFVNRNGILTDQLTTSKFANDHLLHALMKFYIECESTGAHTQFYDKFNIRYEIFQVVKCVWRGNEVYSRQLTRESKINRQFFIRFVNLLLNDTTYVLDEGMSKFPKIHVIEQELKQNLPEADRQKKEEELTQLANGATSYMQLANETLEMMKLFTKALRDAFTMPEIVQRLASMLNYNLETLAGPKASQLKVENADKYHFRPKNLLSDFVDIYLNLGASQVFIEAVAADGRSYKPATFDKASMILANKTTKDPTEIRAWDKLKESFLEAKIRADQAEMDLGEIPSDFEDPILGDLMKDPVILPSSQVVDRSTIIQHLLSDPKDPFTRQPMTIDDVTPDDDLRHRIEQWKEERIAAAKAAIKETAAAEAAADVADDSMDTTEG